MVQYKGIDNKEKHVRLCNKLYSPKKLKVLGIFCPIKRHSFFNVSKMRKIRKKTKSEISNLEIVGQQQIGFRITNSTQKEMWRSNLSFFYSIE